MVFAEILGATEDLVVEEGELVVEEAEEKASADWMFSRFARSRASKMRSIWSVCKFVHICICFTAHRFIESHDQADGQYRFVQVSKMGVRRYMKLTGW